jgi:hypothetical protein
MRNPTALIIVHMQKGMASPAAGKRNNPQAESNIAQLLGAFRRNAATAVHVRHISRTPGSPFWPGQEGVEYQEELRPQDSEHVVEKNIPDAFLQSSLARWLRVLGIGEVVIAGGAPTTPWKRPRVPRGISDSAPTWCRMQPSPSIRLITPEWLRRFTPCRWIIFRESTREFLARRKCWGCFSLPSGTGWVKSIAVVVLASPSSRKVRD